MVKNTRFSRRLRFIGGFTLIEALTAIALASIAGSVLLLGTTSSLQITDDSMQRTIAQGMAQQLMDEIVGCGTTASSTSSRSAYNDIADYNGYRCQPPQDAYGVALGTDDGQGGQRYATFRCGGTFFANWRQEVDVYHVSETSPTTKVSSGDYRAVEVRIVYIDPNGGSRQLAKIVRVIPYVKPLSVN